MADRLTGRQKHFVPVSREKGKVWFVEEMTSDRAVTSLCQRDPVVLQKDDFETVADHGVIVDNLADGCDQTDDHLGRVVSRSGLT